MTVSKSSPFAFASLLLAVSLLIAAPAAPVAAQGDTKAPAETQAKAPQKTANGTSTPADGPAGSPPEFDVLFDVGIVPSEKSAHVAIKLGAGSEAVVWMSFVFDPLRYRAIEGDGKIEEIDGRMQWTPPKQGGSLRYIVSIDHLRDDNSYDARFAKNWAIFRGRDLVPRLRIRTADDAFSHSTLKLRLPEGWSAALPYEAQRNGRYILDDSRTRFDRPNGWFAFGKLGVVRETIDGTKIAIAGPTGQGARRMDTLALLKWTFPALREVFGVLPERLQIVIAGDPMWRGGLSGPRSIYLHVDRPLISGDASSPLLHEIMHSLMHARSGKGGQWIVEGIAEYYSIALLRRSGTMAAERFEKTIDSMRRRAAPGTTPLDSEMNSALRAKAVLVLMEVDRLIRDATAGARSLDDLVRALVKSDRAITFKLLRKKAEEVAGKDLDDFFDRIQASTSAGK